MTMRPVTVRILHPEPGRSASPIERWVASARAALAERHRDAFVRAGAADVAIVTGPSDHTPFGARLRELVHASRPAGLVVLGSGAIPLATTRDYADFVAVAAADGRMALANNRYSADVVAIACPDVLVDVPDLPGDNALPRWLAEVAGYAVRDLRHRWRLALDVDGPLELAMLGRRPEPADDAIDLQTVLERIGAVRAVGADARAELVVTGRVSVDTLAWLRRGVPARIRAIVEERGLRAGTSLALAPIDWSRTPTREPRPPASLLAMLLDRDGPGSLGTVLAGLGEAAVIDTRVLLAARLGTAEGAWPPAEDRFASDLLLPGRVRDPWLRTLTAAAVDAPIPVLLGGHSLVGPGIRLLLRRGAAGRSSWS